ncbi:MAG: hypothetical protein A2Y15_00250 [Clostridiales bacterium GWF2_36_10]|nr:MAG: hypothetical protein A2Y15_00250 [Clostridiales bacterium GWF2_36_10]
MKQILITALLLLLSFSLLGCFKNNTENSDDNINSEGNVIINDNNGEINNAVVKDNDSVYMFDDEGSIVTMYLTVRQGNSSENTNHNWTEVNNYSIFDYETLGVERYAVEGILKIGDENGPAMGEFGYGVTVPNAVVQVRGNTTSKAAQKSYKIEIKRDKGTWREQRTIALNKHPYDESRVLNKLGYDLMKDIPGMISARTQFVHLYVKDETGSDAATTGYVDYGLFTQVEQFNAAYLRNHGLDENGQFYKAEMFEFMRYKDSIKLTSDPDYDKAAFEKILEIKGSDDHTKLIAMLDDLNNYSLDIETVFSKYFDEDNFFTWMAYNILTGNIDTINRNFYLYSPLNSDKFYIIPWDNDGAFSRTMAEYQSFYNDYGHEIGVSNYWGCILHQRILSNAKYRNILNDKMKEIKEYLSKERISELINLYKPTVKSFLYTMPDIMHTEVTEDRFDGLFEAMLGEIDYNYYLYKESIERSMPFYIDRPTIDGVKIKYTWGISFDFDGENVKYNVEIARDLDFTDIIESYENLDIPIAYTDILPMGQYFIRVKTINESGKEQYAMDYYISENIKHYGIYVFYIQPDGSIDS